MKKRKNEIIGYSVWDPHKQFHRLEFDDGYFYGWENLSRDQEFIGELLGQINKARSGEFKGFRWETE